MIQINVAERYGVDPKESYTIYWSDGRVSQLMGNALCVWLSYYPEDIKNWVTRHIEYDKV